MDLVKTGTSDRLDRTDRTILEYAVCLTNTPAKIDNAVVERLRSVGFDDRGIHDICAITAYFGFVNRMADGLGVELEESFSPQLDSN
ncbi:MAG: hypothetical protein L3J79_07025 [Candidatus Marinimicrobia bacterium]|nr:hypothetical protein [Candidatus Neomarinimicrobiota bacterium]